MSTTNASDSDTDSDNPQPSPSKRHRAQKFREEWLRKDEFKYWLEKCSTDPYKCTCTCCNCDLVSELSVIKKHADSKKHRLKSNAVAKSSLDNYFKTNQANRNKESDLERKTKEAEILICAFIAEHNIPFLAMDHLSQILKKAFPDSKIAEKLELKRSKSKCVIKNVIGESQKSSLQKTLKQTKFSVLVDESTDISVTKMACIVVRFHDESEGKVVSRLWELVPLNTDTAFADGSAEHLYQCIIKTFKSRNVPLDNIIGFGSDGCNVMMGQNNSVSSRFRESCPGIFIFKCVCHSLHICASEACKVLPRSCEDLARNVYSFFSSSSKRQCDFVQFQVFCEVEIHKILHPSQTRWLSLTSVVKRLLEQWRALQLYFQEKYHQERIVAAELILNSLLDPFVKLYYKFLDWVLPKITVINSYFQSDKVVLCTLHEVMVSAYKDLLCCYMSRSYILATDLGDINPKNKSYFLNKNMIYLGIDVMNDLQKNEQVKSRKDLVDYFYDTCLAFLSTVCLEIKKRYDFNNPVLSELHLFNPKNALSFTLRETKPSLLPLFSHLERFYDNETTQLIDEEWRQLPCYKLPDFITPDDSIDSFWSKLLNLKNSSDNYLFSNLSKFVLNVLSLPHSNAECERIFSKVNLVKTRCRNRLIVDTINGCLLGSQAVMAAGSCTKFEPSADMIKRMNSSIYNKNDVYDTDHDFVM